MLAKYITFNDRVHVPTSIFNLEGFREWVHSEKFPERGSFSYIGGSEVLVDLSPQEIETHANVRRDLQAQLWLYERERHLGKLYPSGVLLVNDRSEIAVEPDMMFCTWETLRNKVAYQREYVEGTGMFVEFAGSPDLVVEINMDFPTNSGRSIKSVYCS